MLVLVRIFQPRVNEHRRCRDLEALFQIFFGDAGCGHGSYSGRACRSVSIGRRRGLVTGAAADGERRIARKAIVGLRLAAQVERRALRRGDPLHVNARRAQPDALVLQGAPIAGLRHTFMGTIHKFRLF